MLNYNRLSGNVTSDEFLLKYIQLISCL